MTRCLVAALFERRFVFLSAVIDRRYNLWWRAVSAGLFFRWTVADRLVAALCERRFVFLSPVIDRRYNLWWGGWMGGVV
ncbi:MAG: hypothetical protein ACKOF3_07020, partial [Spartobacteria bacterium]